MENADPEEEDELVSREPSAQDLAEFGSQLNRLGARYLVVGGFAIRSVGYVRNTMDLELVIATDPDNEAKVFEALRTLPDRAVDELDPGDVAKYTVVRVNDEITVDLMGSASGIGYEEAAGEIVIRKIGDVEVPFASPRHLSPDEEKHAPRKGVTPPPMRRPWSAVVSRAPQRLPSKYCLPQIGPSMVSRFMFGSP
jgi:hypothetical protein